MRELFDLLYMYWADFIGRHPKVNTDDGLYTVEWVIETMLNRCKYDKQRCIDIAKFAEQIEAKGLFEGYRISQAIMRAAFERYGIEFSDGTTTIEQFEGILNKQ